MGVPGSSDLCSMLDNEAVTDNLDSGYIPFSDYNNVIVMPETRGSLQLLLLYLLRLSFSKGVLDLNNVEDSWSSSYFLLKEMQYVLCLVCVVLFYLFLCHFCPVLCPHSWPAPCCDEWA